MHSVSLHLDILILIFVLIAKRFPGSSKVMSYDPRDKGRPAQSRPSLQVAVVTTACVDRKERFGVVVINHRKPSGDEID